MRWFVLVATMIVSGVLLTWSAQNASLSASPVPDPESYRVAAVILWDVTMLCLATGTSVFFIVSNRRSEPRKKRLAWTAIAFYIVFGGALLANTIFNADSHRESTSWKIWTLTQYPLSTVIIAVGIALFVLLRRQQHTR